MLDIPGIYKNNNEDYITLPAIKSFIKTNKIECKMSSMREELFEQIIKYGDISPQNTEKVLSWIDRVLQEGIKDIYVQYAPLKYEMEMLFKNSDKVVAHLATYKTPGANSHVCQNTYGKNFTLINALLTKTNMGRRIVFTYCKKLFIYDSKKQPATTKTIDYPVIAEYNIDGQWLLVRAKPRSNLYEYNPENFILDKAIPTTTEKQVKEVFDKIRNILGVEETDRKSVTSSLKNKIFHLLDKYTSTPKEIENIMSTKTEQLEIISTMIKNLCSVQDKCYISSVMYGDIKDDIKNIVEKYLSINWKDTKIFTQDREAYPIKLSATDEEESKVEQTAASYEPLQTKALFFDNKKMLYKSQCCDGVTLCWKRKDSTYFLKDTFMVKISSNQKGMCVFKFSEYTMEEDIENVIFSIIEANTDTKSNSVEISG